MSRLRIDYERKLKTLMVENGYSPVTIGRFDSMTAREGICIRILPSVRDERYQDGSYELQRLVQVIVRRRVADEAIETCDWLASLLDGATIESGNGSYKFVAQEIYTEPEEFIVPTDDGYATWAFRLRALLMIER